MPTRIILRPDSIAHLAAKPAVGGQQGSISHQYVARSLKDAKGISSVGKFADDNKIRPLAEEAN